MRPEKSFELMYVQPNKTWPSCYVVSSTKKVFLPMSSSTTLSSTSSWRYRRRRRWSFHSRQTHFFAQQMILNEKKRFWTIATKKSWSKPKIFLGLDQFWRKWTKDWNIFTREEKFWDSFNGKKYSLKNAKKILRTEFLEWFKEKCFSYVFSSNKILLRAAKQEKTNLT